MILTEDPLTTRDRVLLEKVLSFAKDAPYLEAVQYASLGGNFVFRAYNEQDPINEYLPGGIIIRARYKVNDIRDHYENI